MVQYTIKFSKNRAFLNAIRKKGKAYFQEKGISTKGNYKMVIKTIIMVSLYLVPYFLMLAGVVTSPLAVYAMWLIMGLGMAGIGMGVMHDANHNAYSENNKVNKYVGYLLNLAGGLAANWKVQHNRLHHSYTNISGYDEDVMPMPILRFSPHERLHFFHRFQFIYGWFLYGLMTFSWATTKDYVKLFKYKREGLVSKDEFREMLWKLITTKFAYYILFLVIPLMVVPVPWYVIAVGFFSMHFVAGFILGCVFQLAHVMPNLDYPLPDENGLVDIDWGVHQLLTTTDYAPNNWFLTWFAGGLNFQVEHHLFPNVCHLHYKDLSKIVKETADEFGVEYKVEPSFVKALWKHMLMLKKLGAYQGFPEHMKQAA